MTRVLSADWVLPIEGPPIEDGAVAIDGGRIAAVGTRDDLGSGTHYDDADLSEWVKRIAAQPLARAYVYFMHEDDALGTRFAQRLTELWRAQTTA